MEPAWGGDLADDDGARVERSSRAAGGRAVSGSVTWIGGATGTGSWFDAANWSGNQVPAAGAGVMIAPPDGGGPVLDAAQAASVPAVTITLGAAGSGAIPGVTLRGGTFGADGGIAIAVTDGYGQLAIDEPSGFSGRFVDTNAQAGADGFARIVGTDGAGFTLSAGGVLEAGANGGFYLRLGAATDGSMVNDGTLVATAGGEFGANEAAITGTGRIAISGGGSFYADGSIGTGQTVSFGDGGGRLYVAPAAMAGRVASLGNGDILDFAATLDRARYDAASGMLILSDGGAVVARIAVGSVAGNGGTLHLVPVGDGETAVVTSDAVRVFAGGTADWFDTAAWRTGGGQAGAPLPGDTVEIGSVGGTGTVVLTGTAERANGVVQLETIRLDRGGVLDARDAVFGQNTTIAVRAAGGTGTLHVEGAVTVEDTVAATGQRAVLTVQVDAGATMTLDGGTLIAGEEGSVSITGGGTVMNEGLVVVAGRLVVGEGVTLTGNDEGNDNADEIRIQRGGVLEVDGTIENQDYLYFGDNSGEVVIGNLDRFRSGIGSFGTGNRIDVAKLAVGSVSYDVGSGTLTLHPKDGGADRTLSVFLADPLARNGSAGFSLADDGRGGTVIRYTPVQTQLLPMLPVPVAVAPGASVPLTDVLARAFGGTPLGVGEVGLSSLSKNALFNSTFSYWNLDAESASDWTVGGKRVAQATGNPNMPAPPVRHVGVGGYDAVALLGGNQIAPSVYLTAETGATTQTAWTITTVDPAVLSPGAYSGRVDPADIVASAERLAAYYGVVPNSNDCGWIGDVVAAAAGATMPYDDYSTDPGFNVEGGFWRIAYRGSDGTDPVQDWNRLVRPGDVVRMGWQGGGQHTTTVLGVNADGSIEVYDNVAPLPDGSTGIGVHAATYWPDTVPQSITIYRLDPNHQYLIEGGPGTEALQGSVFDNLIRPEGGGDAIAAGAADNWVQGTAAQLDGGWTDLHLGDVIDVQDLAPGATTVAWDATTQRLAIDGLAVTRATLFLPDVAAGTGFLTTGDGAGGTAVVPVPVRLDAYDGAAEAALRTAFAPLARAGTDVFVRQGAASPGGLPAAVAGAFNVGVVPAAAETAVVADALGGGGYGGVILQGSAPATVFGGTGGSLLVGGAAADMLVAGSAGGTLVSGGYGSTLFGDGHAVLVAGAGNGVDTLVGGSGGGGDTLLGGSAAAVFFGGAGFTRIETGDGGGTV
ncbi:MAG: hypothetical protein INR65_12885, partial [Gluconacetobacter diazotrophicus]|nr:hypothetical protein [Gluconacetobacter diazotrophicus]